MPSLGHHANGQMFRVLKRDDGSFYGVAPNGTSVEYKVDDIAILELSVSDLGRRLAAAFDLDPITPERLPSSDIICIGTFERRGLRCPAYLLITLDDDRFTASLASMVTGVSPAVVFVPTPRRIASSLRSTFSAKGLAIIALSDVLAIVDGVLVPLRSPAQLMPSAIARAEGELTLADGVYGRTRLVWQGVEHTVDLTEREANFLTKTWDSDEVRLDLLIHLKHGLLAKKRFTNSPQNRNLVSRFLKSLNEKLQLKSTPRVPFDFKLPVRSPVILRQRHE